MRTLAELKSLPQWVGYTAKKIPMNPHSGGAAASNNPDTWGTAVEAWRAKQRHGWAGIGFVFTIAAGIVGIDLDDCFDEAGRLNDTARQIVQMCNSYTERSPSGRGLHILACGSIPHSVKKPGFEMYNELRYFTVTGNQYGRVAVEEGAALGDIEDRDDALNALFVVFDGEYEPRPVAPRPTAERGNVTTSEAEVARALAVLPPQGDYNTDWLPILMAVHDAFPDERGIALIEAWSPGYRGEVARKWRSFETAPREGAITIATLFHRAKQYGYHPLQTQRPSSNGRKGSDITDALAQRRGQHGYTI
jgi:putative DNA primase/helicase